LSDKIRTPQFSFDKPVNTAALCLVKDRAGGGGYPIKLPSAYCQRNSECGQESIFSTQQLYLTTFTASQHSI